MARISEKIIIFSLFYFCSSCSVSEYKDVTKHNYRNLNHHNETDSFIHNDNNNDNYTRHDNDYNDLKLYEYKKIRNYVGYYKIGIPYKINGKKYYPKKDKKYKETGIASWYGRRFHNRKTANGEIYNMHDYTCAHRTLPMPSLVKITNLENGKSVVARVNDRGPFAKNRIIDVSQNVAEELNFKTKGTAKVKIEYLEKETNEMLKYFGLKFE